MRDLAGLFQEIKSRFPSVQVLEPSPVKETPAIKLSNKEELLPLADFLKQEGFSYLDFVTAVDWKGVVNLAGYIRDPNPNPFLPEGSVPQTLPKAAANFPYRDAIEVVYAFSNWQSRIRLIVRIEIPRDGATVPSLISLYKTADWQERETFDLLGVRFEGHPNLKKILTPEFIAGHPLRKDYVHVKDKYD